MRCRLERDCGGCIDCHGPARADERARVEALLGFECAMNCPVVCAALASMYHGATAEEALILAVRCLSQSQTALMRDLVAVAQSRAMFIGPLKGKQ